MSIIGTITLIMTAVGLALIFLGIYMTGGFCLSFAILTNMCEK